MFKPTYKTFSFTECLNDHIEMLSKMKGKNAVLAMHDARTLCSCVGIVALACSHRFLWDSLIHDTPITNQSEPTRLSSYRHGSILVSYGLAGFNIHGRGWVPFVIHVAGTHHTQVSLNLSVMVCHSLKRTLLDNLLSQRTC